MFFFLLSAKLFSSLFVTSTVDASVCSVSSVCSAVSCVWNKEIIRRNFLQNLPSLSSFPPWQSRIYYSCPAFQEFGIRPLQQFLSAQVPHQPFLADPVLALILEGAEQIYFDLICPVSCSHHHLPFPSRVCRPSFLEGQLLSVPIAFVFLLFARQSFPVLYLTCFLILPSSLLVSRLAF
uniref:Secreted protein n=1 Tax=Meloidogyne incognita TaxID=6306 RepID=A0A914KPL8_MELIC